LSEIDQEGPGDCELGDDIEMASIAEEEEFDEKFSHQGTSTGKHSGKKKVVCFRKFVVLNFTQIIIYLH
jgi:hypothetical protein